MSGLFLGARAGAASQMIYLSVGLAGVPVFALPGAGPGYLLGPTGGYLIGFVAASWVVGRTLELAVTRIGRSGIPVALLAGSATIHLCGLAWLTAWTGGDLAAAWPAGFLPFALFDLSKIILATGIYSGWLFAGREVRARWRRNTTR